METRNVKRSVYRIMEKSAVPALSGASLVSGLALGWLFPVAFIALPFIAVPILTGGYLWKLFTLRPSSLPKAYELTDESTFVDNVAPLGEVAHAGNVISLFGDEPVRIADAPQIQTDTGWSPDTQEEIRKIVNGPMTALWEKMPSDGTCAHKFHLINDKWLYRFRLRSQSAEFNALGVGATPTDAFIQAQADLEKQLEAWHESRFLHAQYLGTLDLKNLDKAGSSKIAADRISASGEVRATQPKVLIIEDDFDAANAIAMAFQKLGCKTVISNGEDGASECLSFDQPDFVVLDWVLGSNMRADQVVNDSVQIIESDNDLYDHFKSNRAKVITYSALDKKNVNLPNNSYFDHLDHWQKPIRFDDLKRKASDMLAANGY